MKLRSLLLLSCMLVVPALAMFSHLFPADFRSAARRHFASALSGWRGNRGNTAPAEMVPIQPASPAPAANTDEIQGFSARATGFMPVATRSPPVAAGLPPVISGAAAGAQGTPSNTNPPAITAEPVPPPLVAQMADRTRQARDQQARDLQALATQLETLGAVSFECQPLPGSDGLQSSSCRVPVDANGQLQRVFQATGPDSISASAALVNQVVAWRQRIAAEPSTPPVELGSPAAARFR